MGDGHAADKPTPPPPPRPVLLAGASGDAKLCRAAALSREEVIRRRRRGLLQLHSLYRAQLWALADELSARHAEYWWEHGSSPDAGNAVGGGAPPPPHPAVNGGGAAVEIAAARAGVLRGELRRQGDALRGLLLRSHPLRPQAAALQALRLRHQPKVHCNFTLPYSNFGLIQRRAVKFCAGNVVVWSGSLCDGWLRLLGEMVACEF